VTNESSDEPDESEAPVADAVETLHGAPVTYSRGQRVLHPSRDAYVGVVQALRADGYLMCVDVTAVDYLDDPVRDLPAGIDPERFEVVTMLINHTERVRVRLRVQVPAGDPTVPTLFDEYPGTEAMEREAFDMFGVVFDGHPDMSRILMPDDWDGHPLRKDYGVGTVPVQFKATQAHS
jgi:NADH-quinone oxidoreductase subunit C